MCPDGEHVRKNGRDVPLEWVSRYLSLLRPDAQHITLTGGEPTLLKERLLAVLGRCCERLPYAQILIISNGRMFYYPHYAHQLAQAGAGRTIVAIALHAATPQIHDGVTGVGGSFEQALRGIQNLLASGAGVEVRVVMQQTNQDQLEEIAALVAREAPHTSQVSFMGLELLGSAALHRDQVWVDYRQMMSELDRAIAHLLQHGIVPRIYNLPLCMVNPAHWSLCAQSISYHKRTYKPECSDCAVQQHCGGMFGTALNHRLTEVRPIQRSMVL